MSAFLIVLPLESMAHGLFHELGNCLGGTCVGYAVVIPTNFCRYGYVHFSFTVCNVLFAHGNSAVLLLGFFNNQIQIQIIGDFSISPFSHPGMNNFTFLSR